MSGYGFGAVVFDLDGTLVYSIPDVIGAMNRVVTETGRRRITTD
jgi:phosphoglycolate phosphatase-like HAD superfamily hydrolase